MSGFAGKKRKQDAVIPNRVKPNKGLPKITVEDIYPFTVSNLEYISPELKQYVNQLERQYVERYNTLINNRLIYEDVIENVSTQLDEKGIIVQKLSTIIEDKANKEKKIQ